MSPKAMLSVGVFALLLILTILTREENARRGVKELALPTLTADDLVEVAISGKYKAHLRKTGESWTVANPDDVDRRFETDKAGVDRMLEAVASLKGGAFVTARKDKHADLEVDEETGTVVSLVTKEGKHLELVFGRAAKGGGNYVRFKRDDEVFVGEGGLAAQLKKNTDQWRNKKLFEAEADAVKSLVVTAPGLDYTVTRVEGDDPTYALSSPVPEGFRPSSDTLSRVVRSFAGLTATGFVDEPKPLSPEATLTATLADGNTLKLEVGPTVDKKAEVAISGDPQRYLISEYNKKNLLKGLDELRDLSLLAGLDVGRVTAISIEGAEGKYALKKEGETWTFNGPKGADTFDPGAVEQKLAGLARVKASRFLGEASKVRATYKDALTLKLTLDDGSVRALRAGDAVAGDEEAKGMVYVDAGDGFVYGWPRFQKDRYAKAGELFKKIDAHQGMPGLGQMPGGGGIQGLEGLPPEIRKQLEAQLKQQGM